MLIEDVSINNKRGASARIAYQFSRKGEGENETSIIYFHVCFASGEHVNIRVQHSKR